MTIYLDVVFLENICMNYIILMATGLICKAKIKQLRILLSATLGSVYAILSQISILPVYSNFVLKMILSITMVYIAFKPLQIKTLLKQILLFYLTSFAFGGCAFFLLYFIRPQDIFMKNGVFIGSYPIKIALLGGIVGFTIINIAFKIVKSKISKKDMFCKIQIYFEDKQIEVTAMIDTGNMLKDPITKSPVIVVEGTKLEELLPKEIIQNSESILKGEQIEIIDEKYISKFRVIPFTSLGKQNGMLLGFKPDKVELINQDVVQISQNIIIGIYDKKISQNNTYNALVGLEIMENEIVYSN